MIQLNVNGLKHLLNCKEMKNLKILHTSDWHLGKIVMVQSMLDDQQYFIEQVFLRALDEYKPDVIVLAGDIFDRSIAPIPAIALFEETLYQVAERGIPLIAVSGNHDSPERLIPAARLLRSSGIYLANALRDLSEPIDVTAADGSRARFFCLPYFDLTAAKDFTGCAELKNTGDAYRALLNNVSDQLSPDCPNILVTHCTVAGAITCESESGISVGGAQQVSSDLFSAFDLTCLGHIHSPQKAGGSARYCGSPLRYSFDRNERDKNLLLYDTLADMSVTEIPVVPLREMRTVKGTFDELMSVPDGCSQDYIFAVVDDDHLIYEPMSRLRVKYPNLLGLDQLYLTRTVSGGTDSETGRKIAANAITDEEIFTGFLRDICKREPTDEMLAFFHELTAGKGDDEN